VDETVVSYWMVWLINFAVGEGGLDAGFPCSKRQQWLKKCCLAQRRLQIKRRIARMNDLSRGVGGFSPLIS